MNPSAIRGLFILVTGFILGVIATGYTQVVASSQDAETELTKRPFFVSVDEVKQKFVLADEFIG